jgi:hypothetical protein
LILLRARALSLLGFPAGICDPELGWVCSGAGTSFGAMPPGKIAAARILPLDLAFDTGIHQDGC